MLIGGVGPATDATEADHIFLNQHIKQLNIQLGANNTSYYINSISHQISGQNHFVHLTGVPDGKHYTASLHQPAPGSGESKVLEVSHGHNPHKHGHGHGHH